MDRHRRLSAALVLLLAGAAPWLPGCAATTDVDLTVLTSNSAQIIWDAGQKALEDKAYEPARRYFRRIIDGFPQSDLLPGARLGVGDAYFQEGGEANYILVVAAYREFLTFYPSNPRADYAQFQVGESYFRQRNPPDRDQTATREALDEFDRLLELYPASQYAEKARERVVTCRQSLAESSYRIGHFYQRTREACRAAVSRYEEILDKYPDYQKLDEVLYHLTECLLAQNRAAEALPRIQEMLDEFPDSPLAASAQQLRDQARAAVENPPPAPEATPSATPAPAASPTPEGETPPADSSSDT